VQVGRRERWVPALEIDGRCCRRIEIDDVGCLEVDGSGDRCEFEAWVLALRTARHRDSGRPGRRNIEHVVSGSRRFAERQTPTQEEYDGRRVASSGVGRSRDGDARPDRARQASSLA
jgi:hypothetical protein